MKIGIIGDTHDHLSNIDRAMEEISYRGAEVVCHTGDWVAPFAVQRVVSNVEKYGMQLKGVLGNNDGEVFGILQKNAKEWGFELGKNTLEFESGGKTIVLYHGTDAAITSALEGGGAFDVVISGHTHEQRNELVGKTRAVNPGTLSGYSPSRGIVSIGEFALYDTDANEAELRTFPLDVN